MMRRPRLVIACIKFMQGDVNKGQSPAQDTSGVISLSRELFHSYDQSLQNVQIVQSFVAPSTSFKDYSLHAKSRRKPLTPVESVIQ